MTTTKTAAELLAPRQPTPPALWYVYSAAEVAELVEAVWAPAADKHAAVQTILDACGRGACRSQISDALRARATKARVAAKPAPVPTPVRSVPVTGLRTSMQTCCCGARGYGDGCPCES